jgi:hypothetical protein
MEKAFDRLVEIYEEVSSDQIPVVDDGDFEFVAKLFLETQAEHLRAAKFLLKARRYASARILGRVMFEGMIFLLWINADRRDRAMKWRAWSAVTDWRLLREQDAARVMVDDEYRKRVLDRAEQVRPVFARKTPRKGDPFKLTWTPTLPQMLESLPHNALSLKELYYPIYQLDSQLIHWTAAGLGSLLDRDGDELKFVTDRQSDQVAAMNTAFHAAWHVIYNWGHWSGMELDGRLETIAKDYVKNYRGPTNAR